LSPTAQPTTKVSERNAENQLTYQKQWLKHSWCSRKWSNQQQE
jgi:hypothetical protein